MAAKRKTTKKRRSPSRAKAKQATYQVFLSHATADKWIARMLCKCIDQLGAVSFRDDRDIDGGDDIPERIRVAIRESREVLVLLSPKSLSRDWVRLELGAAWGWRKRIVILLHHLDADSMPDTFKPRKAYQLNDVDQYLADLKERLDGGDA